MTSRRRAESSRRTRPRPHRAARARAGDALELPRLRDVGHRLARAARRARRPEAGAPARPLRDARGRPAAEPAVQEVRLHRRRRDGRTTTRTATQAIYDTLVRMAQPFSLRYPLVDGQGNFGSIDDDPPRRCATPRRASSRIATELLRDIDANTVDFEPNYDESRRQPTVLPSRFPNLLVNGSTGIAVGMATNMPPHHLGETIDAVVAMIDDPDINVEGLMKHVKGPDFPTGAIIVGRSGIRDAYRTGRGRIVMRARAHIEELRGGKTAIIVTELPYGVKKGGESGVIGKIAEQVRDKVLTEISDLAGPLRPDGHADPDRAQARRDPAGRAQQALQAHGAPVDVRLQRRRARRRRAAHALAARARHALPRLPARGRHAPLEGRAAQGGSARARPRGLPQGARPPRRDHRPDPRRRRRRRRAHRPDGAVRLLARSRRRRSSTSGSARLTALERQERREGVRRPRRAHRRAARHPRRPGEDRRASSARSCSRSSRSTAATTTAAPRSSPPRRSSSSRT